MVPCFFLSVPDSTKQVIDPSLVDDLHALFSLCEYKCFWSDAGIQCFDPPVFGIKNRLANKTIRLHVMSYFFARQALSRVDQEHLFVAGLGKLTNAA